MWLSNKVARADRGEKSAVSIARVTIGGARSAAEGECESRELFVASPAGVCCIPAAGQEALIIECGDGSRVLAGIVQDLPSDAAAGDVIIKSGATTVRVTSSGVTVTGDISVNGDAAVSGTLSVTGAIMLNGLPVTASLPI